MNYSESLVLSVIVCTWKPNVDIIDTLISLKNQTLSAEEYEVVVVLNGCEDKSVLDLESKCDDLGFIYVNEKNVGLSVARNTGIKSARAEIIYFIDDDAIAPCHILKLLLEEFNSNEAAVIGGPVHGLWEVVPPSWLTARHWRMLSLLNYGPSSRLLRNSEIVIGCNMGFRKQVLISNGLFDKDLGRKGGGLIGNEERIVQQNIRNSGHVIYYSSSLYVFHKVPESRLSFEYFRKRGYWSEISNLMLIGRNGTGSKVFIFTVTFIPKLLIILYHGIKQGALTIYFESQLAFCGLLANYRYFKKENDKQDKLP